MRYWGDGQVPTASFGMRLPLNSELTYDVDLRSLKFIEEAPSAKLNVSYYY